MFSDRHLGRRGAEKCAPTFFEREGGGY